MGLHSLLYMDISEPSVINVIKYFKGSKISFWKEICKSDYISYKKKYKNV